MLDKAMAQDFLRESLEVYKQDSWIVGEVVKGSRKARIVDDFKVLSIKDSFLKD